MATIIPIKDLKNTAKISKMCNEANEPIFITKNGYGDMVLMSIKVYEELKRKNSIYRQLELSEKDYEEGRVHEADVVMENLKNNYDI
ncbi:MAG: type II toxin-antitoxin system prevent-host-death family antitoxin [Bacillota bacterium]|nr:type II toxin-antitoxin system prevent-host-death family antitoxin [Bacillota bacterium]